jgi:hypothetical protein
VDDRSLGGRFWLGLIGISLALGVAGLVLFLVINRAFYRWGALGTLLVLGGVLVLAAYIHDRRAVKRARAEYADS